MTCGIYKLIFKDTAKVYIGQSTNIEKRFTQHINNMKNNLATDKLMSPYRIYGYPLLEILEECSIEELDSLEEEIISIYDSVNNGFNTFSYANQAPVSKGTEAPNSKYTKEQILDSINYLAKNINTITSCSIKYGVLEDTLYNILSKRSHQWVSEEYSELVNQAKVNINKAALVSKVNYCKNNFKVSIKHPGYPKVISPEGIIYKVDNINEFAKEVKSISKSSLHRLLSGQVKSSKGWKVCQEEQV